MLHTWEGVTILPLLNFSTLSNGDANKIKNEIIALLPISQVNGNARSEISIQNQNVVVKVSHMDPEDLVIRLQLRG